MTTLVISGHAIQQDQQGHFCLNDLHRAAGGEKRHQPSNWLATVQARELIDELTTPGIPGVVNSPIMVVNGGNARGTYAVKELVYAYAMWISAKFHVSVIRAYDALVTGKIQNQIDELRDQMCALVGHLPTPIKHGYYSTDEDEVIFASKAEGLGARRIARKLNRTVDSVEHRVRWLRERQPNRF